jgi:hypothetical protein
MHHERSTHFVGVDHARLTPIVRQITRRQHSELLDWECQALDGGVGE